MATEVADSTNDIIEEEEWSEAGPLGWQHPKTRVSVNPDDGSHFPESDTTALLPSPTSLSGKPHLTLYQIVCLNAFWFGYQLYWFLVSIVILPSHIAAIAGNSNKGSALSLVTLISGILNLFFAVIFGALNDRFNSRFGKRHPWIIVGSVGMCCSLLLLWPTDALWVYVIAYACLTAATIVASVPFNGLVADITPAEQKARVSAIMGGANLSGYLFGAIIGIFADTLGNVKLYMLMITIVSVSTAITVRLGPHEPEKHYLIQTHPPIEWKPFLVALVSPLWEFRDFMLVFVSRFLFQLGIATIQQFMQFWISDCVSSPFPPTRAVSLGLIPLLTLSPLSALLLPSTHRKRIVYTSTVFMVITVVLLNTVHTFPLALLASAIFGVAYGPFISVEFAMLMDVLPSDGDVAKDMSLWHSALVLPQIVAMPVAGIVRDWGEKEGEELGVQCLGYKVVFAMCVVYFLAGAAVTKAIRGVK
ncbi:major facilitator superfamily domain-containing protein [Gaertneriomyces semiglobifer]|nr:major facilitator superfamily domain-containing protein [Gaertneriomyces semiglobifer]